VPTGRPLGTGAADGRSIGAGSYEERIVVAVCNDASFDELDVDAGLDRRAATNLVAHRAGADGVDGTADDRPFEDVAQVDAVSYVGPAALDALLIYALSIYGEDDAAAVVVNGITEGSDQARAVLELANGLSQDVLDDDVGLDRRAAANIVRARRGPDDLDGTADDTPLASLTQLDAVSYVGASAFDHLLAYARDAGMLAAAAVDVDGDGWPVGLDCDDEDGSVHPGAAEVCDGIDNDCDASTREDGLVQTSDGVTYDSIGEAIRHTPAGGEVDVCAGTWAENLVIDRALTLRGVDGASATIVDGGGVDHVVRVQAAGVVIEGLTLSGGSATAGGGLYALSPSDGLVLRDVVVTDNDATSGGGLWCNDPSATTSLERVRVSGNRATSSGGALVVVGALTATDSELSDNTADSAAAFSLYYKGSSVTLVDSSVVANASTRSTSAAVVMAQGTVVSEHTDWGEGADDNTPSDLYLPGPEYISWLGSDEFFTCSRSAYGVDGSCSF